MSPSPTAAASRVAAPAEREPTATAAAAVSLSALLVEHDNDPARALATLVSRYNRLVSQHAALRQERDSAVQDAARSAQENELLWRSFKANSPRPPPPAVARSNSDQHGAIHAGPSASSSTRGLGIGASTGHGHGHGHGLETTPNVRATKRMPSTDSGLFNRHETFLSSSSSSSSSPLFPPAFSSSPRSAPPSADPASSHWLDYPPTANMTGAAEPSPRSAASYGGGHAGPHHFSPSSLRGKSATPPPPNSTSSLRQADSVPSSLLRKASSLDLGKRSAAASQIPAASPSSAATAAGGRSSVGSASKTMGATSSLSQESILASEDPGALPSPPPPRPPQTPPPPGTNPPLLRRVQPSPRISSSASMPLLADQAAPSHLERRFLPTLSPVSPFSFGGGLHDAGTALLAGTTGFRTAAAAGEQLQAQLQLPRRERTISSGSASFAGPALLDDQRASGLASPPQPPPRSASIQASLSSASPFRMQAQHQYPSTSSSSSLRERRPSVPNKLQYPPSSSASTMTSAVSGLGGSASDGALVGAASSASAPVSRRPSDSSPGILSQPQPRGGGGGLGALPSPTLQTPISPRTPLPMERQTRPALTPSLLPFAQIRVVSSSLRISDRHKELVSFRIAISLASAPASELEAAASAAPASSSSSVSDVRQAVPTSWRVEKSWIELQALDAQVRSKASRQESKGLGNLPDKSLFKDHAPQRSDQRKSSIERYLQTLTTVSLRDKTAIQAFLTSDVVPDGPSASSPSSAKEGWLTKKGRAFGGWQTRYYILTPGSALAYYDTPGGTKVGEIPLQTAQIGRQSSRAAESGDDAYAHALLIRSQTGKDEADHILCADNDEERDAWIQALTTLGGPSRSRSANAATSASASGGAAAVRSPSTERERVFSSSSLPMAPPIPTIAHEPDSPRVQQERRRSGSGPASMSVDSHSMMMQQQQQQQQQDPRGLSARSAGDQLPPSVSLPSNLDALARGMPAMEGLSTKKVSPILEEDAPPSAEATNVRSSRLNPAAATSSGTWRSLSTPDRPQSPDKRNFDNSAAKYSASDVSSPMNAVPLPSGFEFKKIERQKKTKSSFWNFTSRGSHDKATVAAAARPVFGVPLKEAVSISRIRPGLELPAIVYRCVEFLEAKNAENEEGIFRLSGSTNVIRQLKERFDAEGDVNLLQSSEFYDLHAVAGLLKQYLRDLPPPLLTRTLQPEFLRVIDLRRREDQVNALGKLVQQLPIEEYMLFRFFFAHLCTIAQNAETSKMNLRNLGIVFSPTLAIPAPLFTLFLSEFDLVFAVDRETGAAKPTMLGGDGDHNSASTEAATAAAVASSSSPLSTTSAERRAAHRNSLIYEASGANKLMESELLRLRENDDDEAPVSGTSEADQHHHHHLAPEPLGSGDSRATTPVSAAPSPLHRNSSAIYTTSPSSASALSAPSPPRSAGLPSSPRPGASFQT